MLNWRRVNRSLCVVGVISLILVVLAGTAMAQNVFPLTLSGQDKVYMDTNNNGAIDADTDGYFTLTLVTLQDAGDDSGKWAIMLKGHNGLAPYGEYANIFVLDGDINSDGKFHIHERSQDVTYLDDGGNAVAVKCIWAYAGENDDVIDDYIGFAHSIVLEMSDAANPFAGFNRITCVTEGKYDELGGNPEEHTVTIEYNDDNYADTFSFSGDSWIGYLTGNVLTDIGQLNSTEYYPDAVNPTHVKQQVIYYSSSGYGHTFAYIPLGEDGSLEISDGRADGFYLRSSAKPVYDPDAEPARLPEEAANGGDDDDDGDDGDSPAASSGNGDNFPPHCMITTMAQTTAPFGHLWLVLLGLLGVGGGYMARRR